MQDLKLLHQERTCPLYQNPSGETTSQMISILLIKHLHRQRRERKRRGRHRINDNDSTMVDRNDNGITIVAKTVAINDQ